MNRPKISLIAAIGKRRELGKNNKLLWHIPEDLKRFKKLTTGHAVIMGRKTFASVGTPLPQRTNIIITNNPTYQAADCLVTHSLKEAIDLGKKKERKEIFIIGGGQIYTLAMPYADKLYLTIVHQTYHDADAFFPDYSAFQTIVFQKENSYKDLAYTFFDLIR